MGESKTINNHLCTSMPWKGERNLMPMGTNRGTCRATWEAKLTRWGQLWHVSIPHYFSIWEKANQNLNQNLDRNLSVSVVDFLEFWDVISPKQLVEEWTDLFMSSTPFYRSLQNLLCIQRSPKFVDATPFLQRHRTLMLVIGHSARHDSHTLSLILWLLDQGT